MFQDKEGLAGQRLPVHGHLGLFHCFQQLDWVRGTARFSHHAEYWSARPDRKTKSWLRGHNKKPVTSVGQISTLNVKITA
jgi:hypothetical protein